MFDYKKKLQKSRNENMLYRKYALFLRVAENFVKNLK